MIEPNTAQELAGLISRLLTLNETETEAAMNGNDRLEELCTRQMQHIADRIRGLGIPFYDIPEAE